MRLSLLLFALFSVSVYADICICQYPKENSHFGGGYRGEIGFYKMGCAAWLLSETKCRKEKIIDINKSLEAYLDQRIRSSEKIRIGFVGHWSSSSELVRYLNADIVPLMQKYHSSIEVDNTACFGMSDPEIVQSYLEGIQTPHENYLRVEASQVTSIGMWDKLSISFRRADLVAYGDTRGGDSMYPKCEVFHKKRCTGFQHREIGKCADESGKTRELVCYGTIKQKKNGSYKLKKKKRWLYLEKVKQLKREANL